MKGTFMSRINNFFSLVTPRDLTKGVKISTIIHLGLLLLCIIGPLIIPHHRYKSFRPTAYTVQLVRLPGVKSQSVSSIPQPNITKPAVKEPVIKPKAETKPIQKKPAITVPSAKPLKTPTLEEKLGKRLKEIAKREDTPVPQKNWEEPVSASQEGPIITGALGDSGTLGISGPSDFPFQWYLELIHGKISSCWTSPQMTLDKQYSAVISFTITKTGEIINVNIKRSSGISNFDESGLKAIELAKPFPELPPGYQYSQLTVNVEFALE